MLDRDQANIAATLLHGPGHLPSGLFAGEPAAVLRGLRVHANTISHSWLVALEDSFPRTRRLLGDALFNKLSRAFIDDGGARAASPRTIGLGFPRWLGAAADPLAVDLARVEWAWLESYHAADAPALTLGELAALDETALLALAVRPHPAARIVRVDCDVGPYVDLAPGTASVLITRPEAEVQLTAVGAAESDLIAASADNYAPLGNLMARLTECPSAGGAAIGALIAAGGLEKELNHEDDR